MRNWLLLAFFATIFLFAGCTTFSYAHRGHSHHHKEGEDDTFGASLYHSEESGLSTWNSQIHAWMFPGLCDATDIYENSNIHTLKIEYFTVMDSGDLLLFDEPSYRCNGFSGISAERIKRSTVQQFITVSAPTVDKVDKLTRDSFKRKDAVDSFLRVLSMTGFTGIELDFEDTDKWTSAIWSNFQTFIMEMRQAFAPYNFSIMVDAPPMIDSKRDWIYAWKYSEIIPMVDYICVIAYDYQYAYQAGSPVSPSSWVKEVVQYTRSKFKTPEDFDEKVIIGIPSYGYHGLYGTPQIVVDTYANTYYQLLNRGVVNQDSAGQRDPGSFEQMLTFNDGMVFVWQDSTSLNMKREFLESLGVKKIAVYHLGGGNRWFTGKYEPYHPVASSYAAQGTMGAQSGYSADESEHSGSIRAAMNFVLLMSILLGSSLIMFNFLADITLNSAHGKED